MEELDRALRIVFGELGLDWQEKMIVYNYNNDKNILYKINFT